MVRNINYDLEHDHSPLRKCLVATNVPSFASLAAFSGLGMTTRTTLILLDVFEKGLGFERTFVAKVLHLVPPSSSDFEWEMFKKERDKLRLKTEDGSL